MKRPFLTVYDYGQGGVWCVLLAVSETEIAGKYPELQIFAERPDWMSADELADIKAPTLDVDDTSDPFLASLREHNDRSASGET